MTLIAHLSDTHLSGARNGSPQVVDRIERVFAHLAGLVHEPDAIIVTGDVVDAGDAADYDTMHKIVEAHRFTCPVLFCPGNHDSRGAFRTNLLRVADEGDAPINQVCRLPEITLVLCDSSVPGRAEGWLAEETLAWLDDALAAESGRPVFVAMHHPPVPIGVAWIDEIGLRNADRLQAVLAAHPPVAGLLCGHTHSGASARFAGVDLLMAPAVSSRLRLAWEDTALPAMDPAPPPGLAFHLHRDGSTVTHFRVV